MELLEYFRRQFTYDAWANREVLAALRNGRETARSLQLMGHILSSELLWLERLKQLPQSLPVWPEFNLEQCEEHAEQIGGKWREYANGLSAEDLSRDASYKNTKGEAFASTVQDVMTHVLMHSAYHRGQIALEMRAAGMEPAYTDFIHAVRQGLVT